MAVNEHLGRATLGALGVEVLQRPRVVLQVELERQGVLYVLAGVQVVDAIRGVRGFDGVPAVVIGDAPVRILEALRRPADRDRNLSCIAAH